VANPFEFFQIGAIIHLEEQQEMDYKLESSLIGKGYKFICGVDEAGRGPLAGPVFAAACCLPLYFDFSILNDSKKLSEKRREELFELITSATENYSIQHLSHLVIDKIGILNATKRAMQKAIKAIPKAVDFALLDGINVNLPGVTQLQIVDGDAKIASIAAASILAKVARDRFMYKMDKKYPVYDFKKNKGYGTREHLEALKKAGISPIHRRTFAPINNIIEPIA
jgi:ribonuclease HII